MRGVVSPVIILAIASLSCQAYVVTSGSLQETGSGPAAITFNLSGPGFSLVGDGSTSRPPCDYPRCDRVPNPVRS